MIFYIYAYAPNSVFTVITIVLGVVGVLGSVQWLPLSFDLVLVAMLLFITLQEHT